MATSVLAQETLCALRTEINRLENEKTSTLGRKARHGEGWQSPETIPTLIRTGVEPFDHALGGGIEKGALHEIRSAESRDNGAASAFALALALMAVRQGGAGSGARILWIADRLQANETGRPYGPGLVGFGMKPGGMVHATPRNLTDALMIAEMALTVDAFAAVILEVNGNPRGLGLTESRRLHLRARAYRRPLLLLRERGEEEASSALLRFRATPARAAPCRLPDGTSFAASIGPPVFRIDVEKSRTPIFESFFLEWNADDCLLSRSEPDPVFHAGANPPAGVALSASGDRPDRPGTMGTILAFDRAS